MSRENAQAALAQSVERRLGKAEVGGSIPLGSLITPSTGSNFFACLSLEGKMAAQACFHEGFMIR